MCHIKYKDITATVHFHMLDLEKASYYEIVSDIPHKGFISPSISHISHKTKGYDGVKGEPRGFIENMVSTMQVGDSILVPTANSCGTICNLGPKLNMRFARKQVYKDHSYRVWRVE